MRPRPAPSIPVPLHRARAILGAAALVLAGLAGPAGAQRLWGNGETPLAHFAPSPIDPWPGASYRAKDFTLVRVNGQYHLFFTRAQRYVQRHAGLAPDEVLNETCFGHAVSPDLEHWTELDTILAVSPSSIERHHVWAPTFVQKGGVSWLIYTGVTDAIQSGTTSTWIPRYQFICGAYSVDPLLKAWTRLPAVLWQPCAGNGLPGTPWALCNPTLPGGCADFRDPYVLPPPAGAPANSPWLMYFTARPRTDQYNYLVGVAQATNAGPAWSWSDAGAIWDAYAPVLNSKLESPHVFAHGGLWNLFASGDDGINGILRWTALWPQSGPWESKGSIIPMLSGKPDLPYAQTLDPQFWFASEYYGEDGPVEHADYFCFVHAYDVPATLNPPGTDPARAEPVTDIEFRRMLWNADGTFDLSTPNPVRAMTASRSACVVGDTLTLTLTVAGAERQRADFTVAVVTTAGEQAVAPGTVGLPGSAALTDGVVTVRWPTRAPGVAVPADLVVRMGNQAMKLDTHVHLDPASGGSEPVVSEQPVVRARAPGGLSVLDPPPNAGWANGAPGAGPAAVELRQVGATPLGNGIGLLVGLPAAGRGRLDVYDVAGRRLRTIAAEDFARGWTLESWDGRDERGVAARRGIYFVRLVSPLGVATARLLLVD